MVEKNRPREGVIEGYTAEGMGVARIEGMAVFVPRAVRGDRLLIRPVKVNKNYAYGIIEEILEPSHERIEAACPQFARCGGCDFLHMTYEEELNLKRQRVEDALRRVGGFDITIPPVHPSTREGYRNKAQFLTRLDGDAVSFGFYRSRSHQVVAIENCLIQDGRANRLAREVCRWMEEYGVEPYDEESKTGLVRRVYVRAGGRGSQLCLVVNRENIPHKGELVSRLRTAQADLTGVILNINSASTNRVMGDKCVTLWGEEHLKDDLLGLEFRLSPLSFYQVNHTQAERLYQKGLEYAALKGDETVLDLYCGAGTITLLLARECAQAIGNEIIPRAIEDGWENARRNDIKNVRFIEGDAGQAAQKLASEGLCPDVIVTDPPRKGMDIKAVDAIAAMTPKRIVYISCDPASLARDCALLRDRGYSLIKAEAFDMFPATANVETVALLEKR